MPTSDLDIEPRLSDLLDKALLPKRERKAAGGRPMKRTRAANPYVTSVHLGNRITLARDGARDRGVSLSHFMADACELTAGLDEPTVLALKALAVIRRVTVAEIVSAALRGALAAARQHI